MYRGLPSKGLKFYDLLNQSEKFTSQLGKVALASGRLEAELIIFFTKNGLNGHYKKTTLGKLIKIANANKLFSSNEILSFEVILEQRNYITHNIYALFVELIEETILEKDNLLDSDVHLYIETAWQLSENLNALTEIVKNKKALTN